MLLTAAHYEQKDLYPTRLSSSSHSTLCIPRQTPVVDDLSRTGPLSSVQLAEFYRKGFIFEPNFLTADEVAIYRKELFQLLNTKSYHHKPYSITEPNSGELRSLFAPHLLNECLNRLAYDARLMGRVQQILGGDAYIYQSRINYKPGFEGKGFAWHSDFETWHAEDGMPAMHAVSASIILTDNHAYNGPLMLVPGSQEVFISCLGETPDNNHLTSLKKQTLGIPDKHTLTDLIGRLGIEAAMGKAGGLLLFDCNVLHGSNANMSPDPRSNIFFVYNRRDNVCVRPFAARKKRPSFLAHGPDDCILTVS